MSDGIFPLTIESYEQLDALLVGLGFTRGVGKGPPFWYKMRPAKPRQAPPGGAVKSRVRGAGKKLEEHAGDVKKRFMAGESNCSIAKAYGVSDPTVGLFVRSKRWKRPAKSKRHGQAPKLRKVARGVSGEDLE